MKSLCALILVVTFGCNCASTSWQDKTRIALMSAAKAGGAAAEIMSTDKICRGELNKCIASKDKNCEGLARCHLVQRAMLQSMAMLFAAIDSFQAALTMSELLEGKR